MDVHQIDPLLAELRHRVDWLEQRARWHEAVTARLIELVWSLVKPRKEQSA